jgi:regulator of protease activity HflC (stomatin/prohibitin superfamily)
VRLQRLDKSIKALSAEGMVVYIDVTVNYTVAPETVGYLHATVGPDYATRLIEPIIGSAMREMIADYPALTLTTLVQHNIEAGMGASLQRKINETIAAYGPKMQLIHIAGFSARKITLPLSVQQSIEASQVASERIRRFQFVLQQQKLEADRRVIEAEGIRRFQEIVTPAISDSFLRWRGIEATLELAKSPNSKIVVIGSGQNGLPLILDGRTDSAGSTAGATEPKSTPTGGGQPPAPPPPAPPAVNGSGGLSSWGLPEVAAPDAMPSPGVGDNFALTPAH